MLINANLSIAIKDSTQKYVFKKFNIFNVSYNDFQGNEDLSIKIVKNKELIITLKCPICNQIHTYKYNVVDILKKSITVNGCEVLGIPVIFIGRKNLIISRIKNYDCINNKVYAMF